MDLQVSLMFASYRFFLLCICCTYWFVYEFEPPRGPDKYIQASSVEAEGEDWDPVKLA